MIFALHTKLAPEGPQARAIYDAVEQARCEAIGSLRMTGVADNIGSMLEDKYARANFSEAKDRSEAPLEEAVAMLVREKLTGRPVPKSGERVVNLWRQWIEDKASASLDGLAGKLDDQDAFARVVRDMLVSFEMADELAEDEPSRRQDEEENQPQGEEKSRRGRRGRFRRRGIAIRGRRGGQRTTSRPARPRRWTPTPTTCRTMTTPMPKRPARPSGRSIRSTASGKAVRLQGIHPDVRRDCRRRGTLRRGRTRPAARLSRQAARQSVGRRRPAGQPAAAPADGAAEPLLGFRSRGGLSRSGAPGARHHRPDAGAILQAGARHQIPRHGGDAGARQFRLDARPADHGGGHLRRHSGAHAGTLRRFGRDSRLHHARVEGRAGAREMAEGRQARLAGPAQRSAPHHLQERRPPVAAGAPQSRPDDARGSAEREYRRRGAALGASAADWPAGTAQDPDDDLRRRAGGRLDPVGQSPATISNGICAR